MSSSGDSWNYTEIKQTIAKGSPTSIRSSLMYCISPVLCVSKCLGSKPVSCGGRIISLFIFPLLVSLSVLILFPSSHDKHSGFLIRLGKIQNLYLTPSQEGVIYISYNIVQQKTSIGSRQPVSIISITGVAFQFLCNAQTHPLR